MEQKIFRDQHRGIDGDSQISQNRMRMQYNEVEKGHGRGYTLTYS